jgi:hypothetical protein
MDEEDPRGPYSGSPEHGVRFELLLEGATDDGAHYRGFVHLPDAKLGVTGIAQRSRASLTIDPDATLPPERRATLEKQGAALLRAATRAELEAGDPVPHKVVRWRPFE